MHFGGHFRVTNIRLLLKFCSMVNNTEPINFQQQLNEILGHQRDDVHPLNMIPASSIGYCPRQIVNSKLGLKTIPRPNQAQMFMGSGMHKQLQQHELYQDPKMIKFEGEVSEWFEDDDGDFTYLTGHFDAIDEQNIIYDIKTTNGLQYVQNDPKDMHVDQLQTYMNLADDVDHGELVYIQRWIDKDDEENPMPVVQHGVDKDEDYFENELVPKAHEAREYVEELSEDYLKDEKVDESLLPEKCDSWLCDIEELDGEKLY